MNAGQGPPALEPENLLGLALVLGIVTGSWGVFVCLVLVAFGICLIRDRFA